MEALLIVLIGLFLFDALVSWSGALGVGYMRRHVPFCEQQNREQDAHHRELWS